MFYNQGVADFKAEVYCAESGLDCLRLLVEPRRGLGIDEVERAIDASVPRRSKWLPKSCFSNLERLAENPRPASRHRALWIIADEAFHALPDERENAHPPDDATSKTNGCGVEESK
jgi:hypothetical protein